MERLRTYIAIDLKSFYASVECIERGLNPLTTNLVVADISRTEKTICLAITPSLRQYKTGGRARLFEVFEKVRIENIARRKVIGDKEFTDKSYDSEVLKSKPDYAIDFLIAEPRIAFYIEYSTRIFQIYLKYISAEDIYVYSIDEVFMDVTEYLETYKMSAEELASTMIKDVYDTTGITATAGIGPNLYLCKVAMDVMAKKKPANELGVRIAQLDEYSYRKELWSHKPITDFWRVGRGYAKKLANIGIYTMGDIARCSLGTEKDYYNEELLYKIFGVNVELLIDHAWGYEPVTIKDIKEYKPLNNSKGSGQVFPEPYSYEQTKLALKEMIDALVLNLIKKKLVTKQIAITIDYDVENLTRPEIKKEYKGEITLDAYGREIPKHSNGRINLEKNTGAISEIMAAALSLYERIANKKLLVRKLGVVANNVISQEEIQEENMEQLSLFVDYEALEKDKKEKDIKNKKEEELTRAMLDIKQKFGNNAILKGMNLLEGATTKERNDRIGGHKA